MKRESTLREAWRHVRDKGLRSVSPGTRGEIAEFERQAARRLRSIRDRLDRRRFCFDPATAVLKKRSGKAPRPIVVATVENRVVQRAILDVLTSSSSMGKYLSVLTNFGTRGVPAAIEEAYRIAYQQGGGYYLRSDIAGFFTAIPRAVPIAAIHDALPDAEFIALLDAAAQVELSNALSVSDFATLFPDDACGVAQGCALSVLLGDVLLHEFDYALNGRGVRCLRYVDDFVILGPNPRSVRRAFARAQELLGKFALQAYEPGAPDGKADEGWTNRPWQFLGCELQRGIIRPNRRSTQRLLEQVNRRLRESISAMGTPLRIAALGRGVAQTLSDLDRLLKGWGNQYQFCNDRWCFQTLDREVHSRVERYRAIARSLASSRPEVEQRRLLGVHLLIDSKSNPIVDRVMSESRS